MTHNLTELLAEVFEITKELRANNFANQKRWRTVLEKDIPAKLTESISKADGELYVKGSAGSGSDAHYPFIGLYESKLDSRSKTKPFVALTFRADGKGAFLCLTHGARSAGKTISEVKALSQSFRAKLQKQLDANTLLLKNIDLGHVGDNPGVRAKDYEAACIAAFAVDGTTTEGELLQMTEDLQALVQTLEVSGPVDEGSMGLLFAISSDDFQQLIAQSQDQVPALKGLYLDGFSKGMPVIITPKGEIELREIVVASAASFDAQTLSYEFQNSSHRKLEAAASEKLSKLLNGEARNAIGPILINMAEISGIISRTRHVAQSFESPILKKLVAFRNVILEGVAGTGKSFALGELERTGFFALTSLVVFHPSYGYEEFVEGLKPTDGGFSVQDGIFTEACQLAAKNPEKNYLLVIDEINRADTSRVLGDLMNAIEPSKRADPKTAHEILTSESSSVFGNGVLLGLTRLGSRGGYRQRLVVPSNLYILGTMNTTDRSIGSLDLALRRRFTFMRMEPMAASSLREQVINTALHRHIETWSKLNSLLAEEIGRDAQLGHSYFFEADAALSREFEGLKSSVNIWADLLLPQLCEILLTFGGLRLIENGSFAGFDFDGYNLGVQGNGLDAYPHVTTI
jgi:hypothetical protein